MDNFNLADWIILVAFVGNFLAHVILTGKQKLKNQLYYTWWHPFINIPIAILLWSNSIFFVSLFKF